MTIGLIVVVLMYETVEYLKLMLLLDFEFKSACEFPFRSVVVESYSVIDNCKGVKRKSFDVVFCCQAVAENQTVFFRPAFYCIRVCLLTDITIKYTVR